jgi:hypothetical protein
MEPESATYTQKGLHGGHDHRSMATVMNSQVHSQNGQHEAFLSESPKAVRQQSKADCNSPKLRNSQQMFKMEVFTNSS